MSEDRTIKLPDPCPCKSGKTYKECCYPKLKQERNDPCACGSGKKFKICCLIDQQLAERAAKLKEREEQEGIQKMAFTIPPEEVLKIICGEQVEGQTAVMPATQRLFLGECLARHFKQSRQFDRIKEVHDAMHSIKPDEASEEDYLSGSLAKPCPCGNVNIEVLAPQQPKKVHIVKVGQAPPPPAPKILFVGCRKCNKVGPQTLDGPQAAIRLWNLMVMEQAKETTPESG